MTLARTAAVALVLMLGCELPDKQVGLDPEPDPTEPDVCLPACERQTECLDVDAYACLAACSDELARARSASCREAKLALHDCRAALECEDLDESLNDADGGACAAAVAAAQARCA